MNQDNTSKYRINITFAQEDLYVSSNSKSSIYDLKRAISKKYEVPISDLVLRIGDRKSKFDFPDSTVISNSEIHPSQTIYVSVNSTKKQLPLSQSGRIIKFDQVPDQNGFIMIRRVIPADNSCLFNAVTSAIEKKRGSANYLRQVVATYIASEPEKYTDLVLEMPNEKYQQWIMKETNWGGAIETEILSQHFKVEICVVDSHCLNVTVFGSDEGYDKRIYLLYSGSHYDTITRNICEDMDAETDISVFSPRDKYALDGAFTLGKEMNYRAQNMTFTEDDFADDYIPLPRQPQPHTSIQNPVQCHNQAKRPSRLKKFFKKLHF